MRDRLKEFWLKLTPSDVRAQIAHRNLVIKKYDRAIGPSIEWLRKHNRSWEDIIASTCRPDGSDIKITVFR